VRASEIQRSREDGSGRIPEPLYWVVRRAREWSEERWRWRNEAMERGLPRWGCWIGMEKVRKWR
jgi:hypothetical protein